MEARESTTDGVTADWLITPPVIISLIEALLDHELSNYPAWYPLDWYNERKYFWIVYCYQVVGICYEANAVVILEMFVIYLLIVAGAHLDILAMRLSKLGESAQDPTNIRSHEHDLIQSIDVHNEILTFQQSVERTFSIPLFVQFIISGIILCITSFQIAIVSFSIKPSEDIVNLIFYLSFTIVITLEIFLPCYFGTENIIRSNYLTTAVYSSNWTALSNPSKKIMVTLMEGLRKPKILLSGKLFSLTLSTFLVVN
ncbi:odorant receptor 94a-like [Bradysia coprophila]|uniref:odorant receptor 94a-like n=1 Tax=Bradysia coprophila TaxID=38358 RepID=UPI00187DA38F|nr:odorant receptor 94a-like [Bradysia coprophila]